MSKVHSCIIQVVACLAVNERIITKSYTWGDETRVRIKMKYCTWTDIHGKTACTVFVISFGVVGG